MQLVIEAGPCEGHGRSYVVFPKLFRADDDGNGEVLVAELATPQQIGDATRGGA